MTPAPDAAAVLEALDVLGDDALVRLAEAGRAVPDPPAFRGRCLDEAYLHAVARGEWSPDDEARLEIAVTAVEVAALGRVARRHRRGLRTALRGALVAGATARLADRGWQERCAALAAPWREVVGDAVRR